MITQTSRKALIIGCGVAGPAVALFLKRAGFEPAVFEAMPMHDDYAGLFLNIGRNGMRVLEELGVDGPIRRQGFEMRIMNFRSGTGKFLGKIGEYNSDPHGYTVKRGYLHRVLREEVERQGIRIEAGKRLVELQMDADQVTAHFQDGTSAIGDVLIGCDGIHSKTRSLLLPNAVQPSYTGLISYGGFTRCKQVAGEHGVQYMVFGRKAFFGYLVKDDGEIYWFGNMSMPGTPTRKDLQSIPASQWRQTIHELYSRDPQPVRDIVRQTEGEFGVYPIYDMLTQPAWHNGRGVLIGDAIHAISPNAGQGAALALEDAMVLSKCLRDLEEAEQAFARFENLRRERVERIVRYSRTIGQRKHATNPIQVFFRDMMLPHFLKMAGKQSQAWMYDYRIDWNDKNQA